MSYFKLCTVIVDFGSVKSPESVRAIANVPIMLMSWDLGEPEGWSFVTRRVRSQRIHAPGLGPTLR